MFDLKLNTVRMKKTMAIAMSVILLSCFTAIRALGAVPEPYPVTGREENRRLLMELVSQNIDGGRHEIFLEGVDYLPESLVLAQVFPGVKNISNTVVSRSVRGGHLCTVCRIGYETGVREELCSHLWTVAYEEEASCLTNGKREARCRLCGENVAAVVPAPGHRDENGDSVCDACGARFLEQRKGDVISVLYEPPGKRFVMKFVCVQENFDGLMRYVWDGGETEDGAEARGTELSVAGDAETWGTELSAAGDAETWGTELSAATLQTEDAVRRWLNLDFKNYLSLGGTCRGVFLADRDGEVIRDGEWTKEDGVRPGLLLDVPVTEEEPESVFWEIGDLQIKSLGSHAFLFRCVDSDYSDSKSNYQKSALFLCDTVIRSDIGSTDSKKNIMKFGANNNYKNSGMRRWLQAETETDRGLCKTYTGVNFAYMGMTEPGMFSALTGDWLSGREIPFQLLEDEVFFLSVEEALQYRDELWKFDRSQKENPEAAMSPYSRGYWLRTPAFEVGADGRFSDGQREYAVDLTDGNIQAKDVSDGSIGMRPAFCVPQA